MSGLISPEIKQAGFGSEKTLVSQSVSSAINWIPQLDGLTQYIEIVEPIDVLVGDVIEVDFIGGDINSSYARFFSNNQNSVTADAGSNSTAFRFKGLTSELDGAPVVDGDLIPTSGEHTLSCTLTINSYIDSICSYDTTRLMNIPVYNFRIKRNGLIINSIQITNKDQGKNQLAIEGGSFARIVNYTESIWKNKADL